MDVSKTVFNIKNIQKALSVLATLSINAQFWPQDACVKDGTSYDFIIIGAGTAGSVIAHRLVELNASVLLVEAGGNPPFESMKPGLMAYLKGSKVDWDYKAEIEPKTFRFHKGHATDVTRGKMLGGSSSINYLFYTRGNRKDFDNWAKVTNDSTWNWDSVLPYFQKIEKSLIPNEDIYGKDGLVKITKRHDDANDVYLKAFNETGYDIISDTNGGVPMGYAECTFAIANGMRQSTAFSYLSSIKHKKNLHVMKDALVTRILFEGNDAVGVEVLKNETKYTFKAIKEVIVSAGAINTPQILMLSGIGPREHLETMGIQVIKDLPVGQEMKDHVMVSVAWKMGEANPSPGINIEIFPNQLIVGYVALDENQKYPDYQNINLVMNEADSFIGFCAFYFGQKDEICQEIVDSLEGKQLFYSYITMTYPKSRGNITLGSRNPTDPPKIFPGYYSNKEDLLNHAKYLQHYIKINESSYFRSVNAEWLVPEKCGCNGLNSEEFYECYILCMMISGYHFSGSCPMGTVLDSRLKVHGLNRIRVADASIMPEITGANTMAPTIMIGEKCADLIKEDWYNFY